MQLKEKVSNRIEVMNGTSGQNVDYMAVDNPQQSEQAIFEQSLLPLEQEGKEVALPNVPQVAVSIDEARERIKALQEFIQTMMVRDVDYGIIPGCAKPTLFKAGAEKLADIYGLAKVLEVNNRVEDFEKGFFHYVIKVTLINKRSGTVEAEGIGSCNTKEKKFLKLDPYSIVNNVLKMAKKRAIVDAVLSATRTSGIFSQDVDSKMAS